MAGCEMLRGRTATAVDANQAVTRTSRDVLTMLGGQVRGCREPETGQVKFLGRDNGPGLRESRLPHARLPVCRCRKALRSENDVFKACRAVTICGCGPTG